MLVCHAVMAPKPPQLPPTAAPQLTSQKANHHAQRAVMEGRVAFRAWTCTFLHLHAHPLEQVFANTYVPHTRQAHTTQRKMSSVSCLTVRADMKAFSLICFRALGLVAAPGVSSEPYLQPLSQDT